MNGVHHPLEHRVQKFPRLLGIPVRQQLHGALHIGEEHGDLLALTLHRRPGGEDPFGEVLRCVGLQRPEARGWRGCRGHSGHAHSDTTLRTENATELCQASSWITEEHEAELTDHGVEDVIGERQGLTVRRHRPKPLTGEPDPGQVQHRQRDIGANHEPRRSHLGKRQRRSLAGTGGDVEYPVTGGDSGSSQHGRHEKSRPTTNVLLVRRAVDPVPHRDVEPRSPVHLRRRVLVHSVLMVREPPHGCVCNSARQACGRHARSRRPIGARAGAGVPGGESIA